MAFGVTCPTCGKAFSITDEIYQRKVSGRVVTIKCKQCQAGIRVDATKPGVTKISAAAKEAVADKAIETKSVGPLPPQAVAAAMGPSPAAAPPPPAAPAPRMRQATLIGGVANTLGKQAQAAAAALTAPSPSPPPPAPPPPPAAPPPVEILWAVEVGDGQDREMTLSELGRDIENGTIATTALAWRDGMAEWLEIRQVPELAGFVRKASQPKPSPFAAGLKPAIKASAPRIAEPPVSEEVPTQPKAPPLAPSPPAPRAAMPSAPKLPPPPPRASAPEAAPPPPEPRAFPAPAAPAPAPAPFQLAPSAIGASPAPLPVAPAAPAPMPVARPAPTFATPGPVSASTDFEMPKVRSKAPLVIAGVAVVGAVVAAIVLLGGGEKVPVPLAPVAESPAAVTPTTPAPTAAAGTSTATATSTGEAAPGAAAQTTPGSGFAELFATGARDAQGGAAVAPRFDPAVAKKAVAKVLTGVGKCKEPGGPRGVVSAVVAFESSGNVSTVTISDPPFAGTSTASCLSSVLKQASMPPFKGLPGTLSQPISVR